MISWIKLDINILDDAKIKIIRSHPDGNSIVVLWIGLLCLAMKSQQPGIIEISNALPYTVDDFSNLFNVEKKTVELGLALFRKYKMVDLLEDGAIEIINFTKHQSIEEIERRRELTRVRVANYRKKLKPCNALLTHDGVTVTPTDKIRQDKIRNYLSPTSDEVRLSELLFSKVKERNQKFKQPNIPSWAKHIDKLIRLDKRNPSEVETVIRWCQSDTFWQNNILSTAKLREKFDQLFMKMNGVNGGPVANTSPPSSVISCPICGKRVLRSDLMKNGCVCCQMGGVNEQNSAS